MKNHLVEFNKIVWQCMPHQEVKKVYVNPKLVELLHPNEVKGYTDITLSSGEKITVKESLEEVLHKIN